MDNPRVQVFSFERGEFSVVDTLYGDTITETDEPQLADELAKAANFFFGMRHADRVMALRANEQAYAVTLEGSNQRHASSPQGAEANG